MKNIIKKMTFALIIVALLFLIVVALIKTKKFEKLEGYMYAFAAEITNSATTCNATSCNATGSNATSCNATSCNATSCNATSGNATTCNATSSNAVITETIKVINSKTNSETNLQINTNTKTNDKEKVTKILEYNNSEITQDIIEQISNNTKNENIIINIDNNVNVSKELFEAIKGKNIKLTIIVGENQIIFNGKDIVTSKQINTEISYNLITEDTILKEIAPKGVIINFANNGELPGTAIVRIKATDKMKQELNLDKIFVYYYNEEIKELTQLTNNATYNEEGFIEFSINHNSKYLFVNNLIEEKEYTVVTNIDTEIQNKVSFLESHRMYIIIIGIAILTIIIVSVILIIDKKQTSKCKNKSNNE